MSLPTDYHRLAHAARPGIHTEGDSVGARQAFADMLQEHGLPGAALVAHAAQRLQAGDERRNDHVLDSLHHGYRTRGNAASTPRGVVFTPRLPSSDSPSWSLAPSRKRHMKRTVNPMTQRVLANANDASLTEGFGRAHPILALQFPYNAPNGVQTYSTFHMPILSHAHAEEISRDWPDAERAKLLNHLSVAEGKNLPMDHNAPEPTPADPNAPEHAGQPGKKAKLARAKPVAKNEKALVLLGGIKMALQESAHRRGMPFDSSKDLNARTVKLYREMERALNNPDLSGTVGFSALHQLLGRIGAPTETATGGLTNTIALPSVKDVAGLLLNPRHGLLNVLEDRAEARGGYGGTTAGFNPKVSRRPSGFVELPDDQKPLQTDPQTIARGVAEALPGKVAPPSDPGTVKPVDGRSFRSRANKTAVAQELPKPKYEVVPDAEAAPLPVANVDRPNSKHADAISKALFGPGDAKAKVAAAHSALEALGMTNRGSRHRAIKQHIEARRAATKLARPKKPKVHAGATAAEITNKPGAPRIDPQIAGTRLAYHLADLIREFKGDAGKAAHPERAGAIVALAKDALLGKRDAYAKLGEHLQAVGHPHGSAYNWHTVSRSLRDDDLMKRFVDEQFAHVKGTGLMHDEVWRRLQKHYSLESAKAGTDAHNEFWKRATAYFKKHHGGDLKDLKARINNSMYRVHKLREEAGDTAKEGVRGMRGTYYGDAGGEGQKHHMRFARVKVLNQPEKAAHVTWVTPEEREAKGAAEAFERGEIAVRDFIAAQTPGFSAEVDGKVYHSTANGPMVEDHFPLSGFAGSAISQKELYSPAALAKYTAALKADPQHETHPLVVTGTPDQWRVRDGHHRAQAYKDAGRAHVPVIRPI